ncbi:MAG: OmpH family outer membrane protein [Saprospiraceae bacterium]|nr:OmpH family outer membrane protein [Saprospiraceae bacterium]MBK8632749.1 OmpH family outer membrane protein [Saprospiraceae bacterium]MBP7644022.1 OmpH family outer membrane protein [Saprospiraceae bacterium]
MNKFATAFILVIMVMFSSAVHAQKFGYVNTDIVVADLPLVKEANTTIETLKAQLMKKGQDMIKDLQTKYADLQAKQNEISAVQLQVETDKLKKLEEEITLFEKESQQKVYVKSEELLKPIQEMINKAIKEVAAESGYQYIFDLRAGNILYADESTDVSTAVAAKIKKM